VAPGISPRIHIHVVSLCPLLNVNQNGCWKLRLNCQFVPWFLPKRRYCEAYSLMCGRYVFARQVSSLCMHRWCQLTHRYMVNDGPACPFWWGPTDTQRPSPLTIWSADKRKRALFTVEYTNNELTHLKQLHSANCSGNDQAKHCYLVEFIIALL